MLAVLGIQISAQLQCKSICALHLASNLDAVVLQAFGCVVAFYSKD